MLGAGDHRVKVGRIAGTALIAGTVWLGPGAVTDAVSRCAQTSPYGFCLEWTVVTDDGGGDADPPDDGEGDAPSDEPVCWWESVELDIAEDGPFLNDYGLAAPPAGVAVMWQTLTCSDGSIRDEYRWVQGPSAADLAQAARGRLAGELPGPAVAASPPLDVAAIVGVPVFVAVDNWVDSMSESACAGGLCVTVTAVPQLWFEPAEPTAGPVECTGGGSRHVAGADPQVEAAAPGACTHVYEQRTGVEGRPAVWPGVVRVEWSLSWSASDGQSGVLPAVMRSADLPRAVEEVQTVVAGGEAP